MRVTHGVTFQTPGNLYRKEYLDGDTDNYPEVAHHPLTSQIAYTALRLEQSLLYLRLLFGNVNQEQYEATFASIDALCGTYLPAADAPATG